MGSLVKTGRPCFQGDGGQRRLGAVTRHDVHKLSVGFEICCCSWQLNVQPTDAFDTRYVTQHTCMGPLWIRNCIVSVQGGVVSEPARAYTNIIRLRQRNNCHSLNTYENTIFFTLDDCSLMFNFTVIVEKAGTEVVKAWHVHLCNATVR